MTTDVQSGMTADVGRRVGGSHALQKRDDTAHSDGSDVKTYDEYEAEKRLAQSIENQVSCPEASPVPSKIQVTDNSYVAITNMSGLAIEDHVPA